MKQFLLILVVLLTACSKQEDSSKTPAPASNKSAGQRMAMILSWFFLFQL